RQEAVGVTVVAPFEFDDQVASGKSASEAQSAHRCFGAARDEADLLQERNRTADTVRELHFEFGGYAVACALLGLIRDGHHHGGMRVTKEHGAPGSHKVEEAIPVRVEQELTLAPLHDERLPATRAKRTHRTVHAADENFFSFSKNFARTPVLAARGCLRNAHFGFLMV